MSDCGLFDLENPNPDGTYNLSPQVLEPMKSTGYHPKDSKDVDVTDTDGGKEENEYQRSLRCVNAPQSNRRKEERGERR